MLFVILFFETEREREKGYNVKILEGFWKLIEITKTNDDSNNKRKTKNAIYCNLLLFNSQFL